MLFELDDDGKRPPIQLSNELLLLVTKSLGDRDCVALALSGAFEAFASLYDAERWLNFNIMDTQIRYSS